MSEMMELAVVQTGPCCSFGRLQKERVLELRTSKIYRGSANVGAELPACNLPTCQHFQ
jgi:hypothetical protein